jgi:hypothetical protein
MLYYVSQKSGDALGPLESSLIVGDLKAGKLPLDALICEVGGSGWVSLVSVAEFATVIREIAPPPNQLQSAVASGKVANEDRQPHGPVEKGGAPRVGIVGIVIGLILGAGAGFASSQFFPFIGADGLGSIAQPFSTYRLNLVPQHVLIGMLVLGVLGLLAEMGVKLSAAAPQGKPQRKPSTRGELNKFGAAQSHGDGLWVLGGRGRGGRDGRGPS